jgi:hypothetical protein
MEAHFYPPSEVEIRLAPIDPVAEGIRREHLKQESLVQLIAFIYALRGLFLTQAWQTLAKAKSWELTLEQRTWMPVLLVFGIPTLVAAYGAYGLFRLKNWGRILAIVVAVPGCVVGSTNPLAGVVIGIVFIGGLARAKTKRVFSIPYQNVMMETAYIKKKTSKTLIVLLAVLVAALVAAVCLGTFLP